MKDGNPETPNNKFPPCAFSNHCERLLDDLDKNSSPLQNNAFQVIDNDQDRQLLIQLQAHIPTCPTCTFVLSQARIRRFQQRQHIRRFLLESEQLVPSSATYIMQAIAREPREVLEKVTASNGHNGHNGMTIYPPLLLVKSVRKPPTRRSQKLVHNLLAFVAVLVVILVSFNLFSHMVLSGQSASSAMSNASALRRGSLPVTHSAAWSSVIIALTRGGQKIITATDSMTGKSAVLASSRYIGATSIDGVSHDGYQVLYHVFDGYATRYYLQPSTQNTILYTVTGKGGPALWSTDDAAVFISTPEGIEKVDVSAHTNKLILSTFKSPDLRFYSGGYPYFVVSADASTALNRMDLTTREVTPITAQYCQFSYDFWLSASGTIIYYRCKTDPAALYGVGSDGAKSSVLRADSGRLIGYDAKGEPLTLLKVNTVFQVVKLGAAVQQDQIVVENVAPGASDLDVDSIAVAPYGFSLLALAHYADGTGKLWYDDLVHQKQTAISTVVDSQLISSLQIGGWARLQVPASAPALGQ
jgi:hypothetical protein